MRINKFSGNFVNDVGFGWIEFSGLTCPGSDAGELFSLLRDFFIINFVILSFILSVQSCQHTFQGFAF
jgi:hypothetical protein